MWGVGNSLRGDEQEYIRKVALGSDSAYDPGNESYAHLWQGNMEAMGIDMWHPGDYGLSERISFDGVYHSTHSYSEQYASSGGDTIWGKIGNFLSGGRWPHADLNWEHENMVNISQGEQVYIYPHMDIDLPGGDAWRGLDIEQYIFIRTFDAYSASQEWMHDVITKDVSSAGDRCEWIPRLDCGRMGKYDLYYVIDVAYFNKDVLKSIPGLNLFTDTDIQDLIDSDKALFMERYGGVIYGDNHIELPSSLAYHEIGYEASGGLSTFFSTIEDIQMGWVAFTSTGNSVVDYGFTLLFGIFGLIFSLSIYYEIKSYLPFISGGEGGE